MTQSPTPATAWTGATLHGPICELRARCLRLGGASDHIWSLRVVSSSDVTAVKAATPRVRDTLFSASALGDGTSDQPVAADATTASRITSVTT